ncbi:MAG: hypothetical protein NTU91_10080 [Chloroflexi bacterium]|nr:hypothetical protein [Chloroflexota bacterium]
MSALCAVDGGAGSATAETRRRAQRWMAYLEHFRVFAAQASGLCVRQRQGALGLVSLQDFARRLLNAYRTAAPNCIGEVAVPVDRLRRDVGASFLADGVLVTRRRFDMLLGRALARQLRSADLHRSMGAGEQLFHWRGGAFEALSLRRERDV